MKTTFLPEIRPLAATPASGAASEDFVMPCAVSQQRFWVLDQLVSGNSALNIPIALELKGPLDVDALHRAIHMLIRRHETLRTTFTWLDEEVKQVISPEVRFYFQQKDLTSISADLKEGVLLDEMKAEALRPLSLTKAPIFRARLLRLDVERHALLLTLHHIICDGWANGVLLRELGLCYRALVDGKTPDLPDLPIQYADFAVWQRDWLKTPDFADQLGYWEKQLSGNLPVLDFPTDRPRKTGRMFPSHIDSLLLPTALTADVKRMCQDLDLTIFMVLFATFATLLHRYSGQTRFIIGTTVANRTRPELENLIGQFANPMMLRADLADGPTFRELMFRVRDLSLGAMSHQEVPFENILERLETSSERREKPAIQALFLFQKAFMQPAQYGDLSIRPLRSVSPGTTFEFTLGIVERAEGVRLQMEYNTALLDNATIQRMLRHFQVLLEAGMENPDTPVGELPLLTEEERTKALAVLGTKEESAKASSSGPNFQATIKELQGQLDAYFREVANPIAMVIEPPAGVVPIIMDSHLRLVPPGVLAELYLSGVATEGVPADRLVSGPQDSPSPLSLFRTEFLGRNREDGKIEILGTAEDLAQVSGFRVNLRQIEALLLRHPSIQEAAAAVSRQPNGNDDLNCYVVPKAGALPPEKELRALLKGRISDFTLPAHIVSVPELPKDSKGRVQPELLPSPAAATRLAQDEKAPLEAILYQQLIEIWCEILKVQNVNIEDNFFALGGTSLLALRMMMQLEKLCGRPLPLSLLLTGATISNLAHHIVEAKHEAAPPLVPLQPRGTRQPIFFLHGDWAGGGFYCGRLSEQLGLDQPFYALTPYRQGKQDVLSMEEMAAAHIAAMQEHTPHGPYLIGGYCIGATVAMEMARQLEAKGERVTRLLLIDPPLWGTTWLRFVWPVIDRMGRILDWDLQKKIYYFDYYAVSFARWLRRPWRNKVESLSRRLGLAKAVTNVVRTRDPDEGNEEILKSMDYAVYFLAYRRYRAKALTVPATIFLPESTSPVRLAWVRQLSQRSPIDLTVEILPGDHHTCITKHTSVLVEKIQKTLQVAQRNH
jgi:pimeloyl-ACP methyl ester carboxylesterase